MSSNTKRVSLIVELAEVSPIKAKFLDSIISDIPFNQIVPFFKFRASFLKPYANKDYATVVAHSEWERINTEKKLQSGEFLFSDIYDMVSFIQKHYKGKKLIRGAKPFYGDVIIKLNDGGNMLNDTHHNNEGYATRISQKEESEVYEWLFANQHKIGFAPVYLKDKDIQRERAERFAREKQQEINREESENHSPEIAKNVSSMIKKVFGEMNKDKKVIEPERETSNVSPSTLQIEL
jgi:hypothetical protein